MHLEIADSGIVGVQFVPMGGGKLFLWFLKPDGGIFRMNRLVGFKVGDMGKQGVYLLHAFFLRLHLCPDGNDLPADGIQITVSSFLWLIGWGGGLPPHFGQKKSRKPFRISCLVGPPVGGYYLVTFLYQT